MMEKVIKRIILLSVIITLTTAQYIITSNNYASVVKKVEKLYLNAIIDKIPSALESTAFESIMKTIDNKSIEITKIVFEKLFYDHIPPYINLAHNIISYSPNLIKTVFAFKYKIDGSTEADAKLYFTIYNLIIEEREDKESHKPDVQMTIEYKTTNYEIKSLDSEMKEVPEIILKAIIEYFPSVNIPLMQKIMSSAVNKHHIDDLEKQKTSSWSRLSTTLGELNVYNDMTRFTGFCTDLMKEKKIGQCFYSGNTTQELNYNLKEDILSNPSFISDSNSFHIFVNFKMLQEIFNYILYLKVTLRLNEETKPTNYPYQFIVANLIPFFPSLASLYIGRYPFTVNSEYNLLQMLDKSIIKVAFLHSIDIIESDNNTALGVIKFKSEMLFEFKVTHAITNINLCLKKKKSLSIKVIEGWKPVHKLVDVQGFEKEFDKILALYLKHQSICFGTEEGLNFDDYIKFIDFAEVNNKGIYLKGKSMFE